MSETTPTCANCDRRIGRLERPFQGQGHTDCRQTL